jgi:GT2 family glycosyltransferase
MLDRWVRHERDDVCENLLREGRIVANHRVGFVCLAATPVAAGLTHVYARITWRDGLARRARIALEPVRSDPLAAIAPILDVFLPTHPDLKCLLDHHVGPAIQAIWSQRRRGDGAADIRDFGTQPFQPGVSLVIPLYGRIDFIEFQLANFVDDPDMTGNEIIYVLDDPSLFTATLTLCREVGAFYQVPFRLVCAGRRLGFAAASNLGAGLARGRLLLLMNSDVLPTRAGWLADLAAAHQALPDAGAVAPRLIYEDGSTQHEGMRFVRHDPWAGMWVNEHPRKGQPGCGYEAPVEIAALTGACLLLDRSLFASIGGLSEDYIVGDFEDSDLCLRLLAAGRRNWLVPYVVLVHLERQSQELVQGRTNLSLLNCWIHHTRWNADISRRVGV